MIYFDNAATTFPKPNHVRKGLEKYFCSCGANPGRAGHKMAMDTAMEIYSAREEVAKLFGMNDGENIVFTVNCTHAINQAICGVIRQGDHIIISDMEHNSVWRTVHSLQERGMATYSIAQIYPEDIQATVESYKSLIQQNTKLICCIHGSNVFGTRLPVEELCVLAHSQGIMIMVDAAQTAGVLDIDMQNTPFDMLCTAGHKSLYGPTGTGILATRCGEQLMPMMYGGTGSNSVQPMQPDFMPDHLESGTLNTLGIIGLRAGVSFVSSMTTARIYEHEISVCRYIYCELKNYKNVTLYTPIPEYGKSLPVLSFNCGDYTGEETAAKLSEKGFALRGGLHCSPLAHNKMGTIDRGTARISPGCFNSYKDAEKLCSAIKNL